MGRLKAQKGISGALKGCTLLMQSQAQAPKGHRAEVPLGGAVGYLCSREPRAQHLGFHVFQT